MRELQKAADAATEKARRPTAIERYVFCPQCGERDKLAPHTEYFRGVRGGKDGCVLTGKTECRNCNHVF